MTAPWIVAHVVALLGSPVLIVGVVNRTKARWAGRKGPPLMQMLYDIVRLLRKRPVYSDTTTPVFWIAPYVVLSTAVVSGLIVPILGNTAPYAFPFDVVFFAYIWGLGRAALMLAALDTGSAFEGMGASREATYAALIEPAFFLAVGTLAIATGSSTFSSMLALQGSGPVVATVRIGCLVALAIMLQVESARMPVDDPTTHLELTMIHEVMILDHSGPDLAAMEYGSAIKLTVSCAMLATLLNPFAGRSPAIAAVANLVMMLVVAAGIGTVESLMARLRLRTVPRYIVASLCGAAIALFASAYRVGGGA